MSLKSLIVSGCIYLVSVPLVSSAHPSKVPHRHVEEIQKEKEKPDETEQKSDRRSFLTFSFGPTLNYTSAQPGDFPSDIREMGGGIDLAFNVRIDPYVGFRMNGMLGLHDAGNQSGAEGALLTGITGDALLYILPKSKWIEPYALIGIGGFSLDGADFLLPLQGFGAQLGLGIRVRLNPAVSLALEGLSRMAYVDNSQERLPYEPSESALIFLQSLNLKVVLDL